ncbi:hypothetical protein [Bradyrhizobium japonicum]|uniref:hypothetical protein n=1 Tax=Bradyrhizobium japonicum TaxID=375 RepID=UPI00126A5E47|nr:hypothetical protein [Bradyrhizobium japonicum]
MMNSDETKIAFDGPEGLKALEIIKRIGESGQASVDVSTSPLGGRRAAIHSGLAGGWPPV